MTWLRKKCLIGSLLSLMSCYGCKTINRENATAATLAAESQAKNGVQCSAADALSQGKLQGQEIYDLTARCVFSDSFHEVRIQILGETFEKVLADGQNDVDSGYGHVIELNLDGHPIKNVGIKVRGNTSKGNLKRQFKFKFDETEMFSIWNGKTETKEFSENKDRTYFGLASFSVRASANDPAMIRENISSFVFSKVAQAAPTSLRGPLVYRTAFTKLLVSYNQTKEEGTFKQKIGNYYYDDKGFYSLTEDINKTFLNTRFASKDKKLDNFHLIEADKGVASFNAKQYTRKGWSAEYVKGKKAKSEEDLKEADALILKLGELLVDKTSDDDLAKQIDIDSVVNYMAGALLSGHWDSILANANNDYLFFNNTTQKWQVIVWDLDNSQGANHDIYKSFMSDDLFQPAKKKPNAIFTTVFAKNRPKFRNTLKQRVQQYFTSIYASGEFDRAVDKYDEVVRKHSLGWENYNKQNYTDIKKFAKQRYDVIKTQLQ